MTNKETKTILTIKGVNLIIIVAILYAIMKYYKE